MSLCGGVENYWSGSKLQVQGAVISAIWRFGELSESAENQRWRVGLGLEGMCIIVLGKWSAEVCSSSCSRSKKAANSGLTKVIRS